MKLLSMPDITFHLWGNNCFFSYCTSSSPLLLNIDPYDIQMDVAALSSKVTLHGPHFLAVWKWQLFISNSGDGMKSEEYFLFSTNWN